MLTAACAHRLAELGLGTHGEAGATIHLETLPGQPDGVIGVYSQPGRRVAQFRRPGVQIVVRGDKSKGRARTGYELAEAILDALDGDAHVVWGADTDDAVRVAWCEALQAAPVSLGDDENGSPRWSVRFDVELAGEVL